MSYVGKKPAQTTIPADDSVTTTMLQDDAVTSAKIDDETIVNADVNASAAIALSKLASDPTYDDSGVQDDIALLGFKVAANGSLAKYNLVDQTIDDFQDASGVDAGASTNEVREGTGKYYSGVMNFDLTGGTETVVGDYTYHLFTSNDDFVVPSGASGNIEALIAAGGGGGGGNVGGGGGAGGVVHDTALAITAGTYAVVRGSGGSGAGGASGSAGGTGGDTTAFGWTAKGGGGGGCHNNVAGNAGGSGGAGGAYSGAGGATNQTSSGTGSSGTRTAYGNAGEASSSGNSNGGGAFSGTDGKSLYVANFAAGNLGGANYSGAPVTSSYGYFGGGGGSGTGSTAGGGAGAGAGSVSGGSGHPGVAASGTFGSGGGGGGEYHGSGGNGSQGSAVIRYLTSTFASTNNMTLVSNTTTAQAAPTKGDIVFTYTNGAGTTTIGGGSPDVTAEYSADGGSTWTSMTLASEGSTGGHNIATAHDVALTSTSGTSMAYRIKTLNQSVSKTTRIQAVSLGWS